MTTIFCNVYKFVKFNSVNTYTNINLRNVCGICFKSSQSNQPPFIYIGPSQRPYRRFEVNQTVQRKKYTLCLRRHSNSQLSPSILDRENSILSLSTKRALVINSHLISFERLVILARSFINNP